MAQAKVQPFDFSDFDAAPAAPAAEPPVARPVDGQAFERGRKAAYAEGVEAARRETAARASEALSSLAASFGAQIAEFDAIIAAERRALKTAAADFLKAFTAAIVKDREVEIAIDLVRRLMAASTDQAPAILFLNPQSLKLVGDRLKKALAAQGAASFIALAADAALAPGDCRLEWRGGAVNRSLSDALAEIDAIFARANMRSAIEPRTRAAQAAAQGE